MTLIKLITLVADLVNLWIMVTCLEGRVMFCQGYLFIITISFNLCFREAVKQLVPKLYDPDYCPQKNENKEDVKIGSCVEKLNITTVDTRDYQVKCF